MRKPTILLVLAPTAFLHAHGDGGALWFLMKIWLGASVGGAIVAYIVYLRESAHKKPLVLSTALTATTVAHTFGAIPLSGVLSALSHEMVVLAYLGFLFTVFVLTLVLKKRGAKKSQHQEAGQR